MTGRPSGQCLVKREFIFYLQIFALSRTVQCTSLLVAIVLGFDCD